MLSGIVMFPDRLNLGVGFQLHVCFGADNLVFQAVPRHLCHQDGRNPPSLIIRANRNQKKVDILWELQSQQKMNESEGKQPSFGALQSP